MSQRPGPRTGHKESKKVFKVAVSQIWKVDLSLSPQCYIITSAEKRIRIKEKPFHPRRDLFRHIKVIK